MRALLAQIEALDPDASTELLERAWTAAPGLLAVDGLLGAAAARDREAFYAAQDLVMGREAAKTSHDAYLVLVELDKLVSPEIHQRLLGGEREEFAEQAIIYASEREDAAYALGLAVGLLFAGGVR